MKCQQCGTELAEGAMFCQACGVKVVQKMFCPECGMEVPDGAKFCASCGTKIMVSVKSGRAGKSDDPVVGLCKKYIDFNCFGNRQVVLCKMITPADRLALKDAAKAGSGDAHYILGWVALINDKEDLARKHFRKGAELGSAYAQFAQAKCLYMEAEHPLDEIFELLSRAEKGTKIPALWEQALTALVDGVKDIPFAMTCWKKILKEQTSGYWDPSFGNFSSVMVENIPLACEGDFDALATIAKTIPIMEDAANAHATDTAFDAGVNSWILGNMLGRIMKVFEEAIKDDEDLHQSVREMLLELHTDEYGAWYDDIDAAADVGSQIAKNLLNDLDGNGKLKSESDDDDDDDSDDDDSDEGGEDDDDEDDEENEDDDDDDSDDDSDEGDEDDDDDEDDEENEDDDMMPEEEVFKEADDSDEDEDTEDDEDDGGEEE